MKPVVDRPVLLRLVEIGFLEVQDEPAKLRDDLRRDFSCRRRRRFGLEQLADLNRLDEVLKGQVLDDQSAIREPGQEILANQAADRRP